MRTLIGIFLCTMAIARVWAEEKPEPAPKASVVFRDRSPQDSLQYKMPAYRQGVICNFEDQLNRKKVPLNFQLGNSKY